MKSDRIQAQCRRGSSPYFQESEQGFFEWMKNITSTDQKFDPHKTNSMKAEQESFNVVDSQEDKDIAAD